ncbi:chloramphenicol acetyltransferase [Bacteroides salyersiae]|uniref:chloramphenicol acetyltransferase n=1 Tax=Bacteroides salyersiae TaxID=291644 RepID=UPI00125E1EAB|nr:chloramphenicol acetyltransferase [Bacteroides salyersiae]KAB5346951.1 chloramphenicol acetyltransferase [Bacteroides salyersiae]KAB5353690.1 chloramphenicol acetyltransferase [Bacteroides salyersiae]KAB5357010.1 chloramphenicol acetyltransferase [Bacteroides salyersiae]KAB5371226.1 chloramphenicol acetyltransferase [Bacteroides salyersiae]KAB5377656.1 chloramphenicol acetyltransferase [Bacteroides salyersiae]
MKHIIDINTWERKENYEFFLGFQNPTISITSEVECAGAKARAKAADESFFLHYLYAVLRAVNEIPEFRFRIDAEGRVVYFDHVDMLTPIKVKENGRFFTIRLPWNTDFQTFYTTAKAIINDIDPNGNPYDMEKVGGKDLLDVILLSATPDLYFTSLTCTQEHRHGSNYPLMNAGKAILKEGKLVMPIAMTIHHGFIDGHHLSLFYKKVEKFLK